MPLIPVEFFVANNSQRYGLFDNQSSHLKTNNEEEKKAKTTPPPPKTTTTKPPLAPPPPPPPLAPKPETARKLDKEWYKYENNKDPNDEDKLSSVEVALSAVQPSKSFTDVEGDDAVAEDTNDHDGNEKGFDESLITSFSTEDSVLNPVYGHITTDDEEQREGDEEVIVLDGVGGNNDTADSTSTNPEDRITETRQANSPPRPETPFLMKQNKKKNDLVSMTHITKEFAIRSFRSSPIQDTKSPTSIQQEKPHDPSSPIVGDEEELDPEFDKQELAEEEKHEEEKKTDESSTSISPPTPIRSSPDKDKAIEEEVRFLAKAKQLKMDGMEHWSLSEYEIALKEFQRALVLSENILGTYNEQTSQIYFWIGLTLHSLERYNEALVVFRRTLRIQLVIHNGNMDQSTTCASIQQWITKILHAKNTNNVYITMYNKALMGSIQHQLNGVRHLALNDPTDAVREFISSLALERSCKVSACNLGGGSSMTNTQCDTDEADIIALIGDSYRMQKKFDQASEQYLLALSIYQEKLESTRYSTLRTYHKYIHASTML